MSQSFELLSRVVATDAALDSAMPEVSAAPTEPDMGLPAGGTLRPERIQRAQSLFLSGDPSTPGAVVLCGVDNSDESSLVCADLARVLCANGHRSVGVIDANTSMRGLSALFTSSKEAAIRQRRSPAISAPVLLSRSVLEDSEDGILSPTNAALRRVRDAFDYILIDAPGANFSADAIALGRAADGVILVIKANSTRRKAAVQAVRKFRDAKVCVLGVVLTGRTFPIPEFLYHKF
jgi:Mrp family chromosome partitioning ATPase